jgi:uncharacterized protein with HEPN domain
MRDGNAILFDLVDSARLAVEYVGSMSFADFQCNVMAQDAVIRRLTVVGEAAKLIPADLRSRLPDLPFGDMARMRDKITHSYWQVDLRIVWDTATRDMPTLIAALEPMLPDPPKADPK